jgi:DNA-binding GntR family transcriptional regulator
MNSTNQFKGIQHQVYESLLNSIVELEIPPRTRLTIQKLKSIYNVSSTPIRGSLYKLVEDDLIENGPSKSFYVKEINEIDVRQIFSLRLVLERLALKESINKMDMTVISDLILRMRVHLKNPEETKTNVPYDIDYKLHNEILKNCGNHYLMGMMKKISTLIKRMRNVIKYYLPDQQKDWIIKEMEEHLAIAEGILNGSFEQGSDALEEHLIHSEEMICSILKISKIEYKIAQTFIELEV